MSAVKHPRINGAQYLLPGEYELLYDIANHGALCPCEFGNGRPWQNISVNLQRLALRGLVQRSEYGWYSLTPRGWQVVES